MTESVALPPDHGSGAVPEYRVYFVGPDGHFLNFKPLICGSDDEALAEAKQLVDGHAVELWSGERFITKVKHEPE